MRSPTWFIELWHTCQVKFQTVDDDITYLLACETSWTRGVSSEQRSPRSRAASGALVCTHSETSAVFPLGWPFLCCLDFFFFSILQWACIIFLKRKFFKISYTCLHITLAIKYSVVSCKDQWSPIHRAKDFIYRFLYGPSCGAHLVRYFPGLKNIYITLFSSLFLFRDPVVFSFFPLSGICCWHSSSWKQLSLIVSREPERTSFFRCGNWGPKRSSNCSQLVNSSVSCLFCLLATFWFLSSYLCELPATPALPHQKKRSSSPPVFYNLSDFKDIFPFKSSYATDW